jgi:hypothetical protein
VCIADLIDFLFSKNLTSIKLSKKFKFNKEPFLIFIFNPSKKDSSWYFIKAVRSLSPKFFFYIYICI